MVVILVKQEWIQEIGGVVEKLFVIEDSGELKQLLASKVEMEFPFVYAHCASSGQLNLSPMMNSWRSRQSRFDFARKSCKPTGGRGAGRKFVPATKLRARRQAPAPFVNARGGFVGTQTRVSVLLCVH
jgi:hypothetical protein